MTLKEIAEKTGVSVSAVSKALAGAPDISEETRRRIEEVARESGYRKTREKGRKNGTKPLVIAVVTPDMKSRYFAKILECLDEQLYLLNGRLAVGCSRYDAELEAQYLNRFCGDSYIDGIVLITPYNGVDSIPKGRVPIVAISQTDQTISQYDAIKVDDSCGIQQAVERFLELGHRKIAYIGERLTYSRLNYFRSAMNACGEKPDESMMLVSNKRSEEAGYESMVKLIEGNNLPTAIFAAYDSIASGAMSAMSEHGIRVPEDVSVVGFDNVTNVFRYNGKLSTIDCHIDDQTQIALSILKKKIYRQEFTAVQNITIKTELVERSSLAKVRE